MCRPDGRLILKNQGTDDYVLTIIQYCIYKVHGRYNLLLLLKTNNQMWLAGA